MYKCGCSTYGEISKSEWNAGLLMLKVQSLQTFKSRLGEIRQQAQNVKSVDFRNFYKFVFEFSKETGSKTLDSEAALMLLDILIGKVYTITEKFKQFIQNK